MQPTVYLAGAIAGLCFKGATSWREYAKEELAKSGIVGRSPMRAKEYLSDVTRFSKDCRDYAGNALSSTKGITTRDRFDVMTSDVILVNFLGTTTPSIGTSIELGWADAFRKPVVMAIEPDNVHDHAIVKEIAGYQVPTLDEALAIVKAILSV